MSDIRYLPNLEYEKNYDTKGLTSHPASGEAEQPSGLTDGNESTDNIIDLISAIPNDLAKHILPPIVYIINTINSIGETEGQTNPYITIEEIEAPYVPGVDVGDIVIDPTGLDTIENYHLPVMIFPSIKAFDIIVIPPLDKTKEIDKQYKKDMSDILNDFVSKMESKVSDFLSKVISVIKETQSDGLIKSIGSPYTVKTSDIKDKNLKHISDTIVRTQIMQGQKVRMTKKMFSLGGATVHIKSCKAASELRKRYHIEELSKTESVLDIAQNSNLVALKAGYDKKYKENFYNLYKYMNGAVLMIDECLKLYIQETQAKAILLKKEGIKL